MEALATKKTPSAGVVLPHYIYAACSFFILAVLLLLSSNSFIGHYFQPKLLAITHIAALGWGTMVIFGALYQLLPVLLQTSLYSETLAKITFFLFGTGIIVLTAAFWNFSVGLPLQAGSVLILLAFIFFTINLTLTTRKADSWSIEADFILTSVKWLLLTGILGTLMAFNFRFVFLPESHLLYLNIHAHLGMAGWFLLLIMGVGSRLLPMFLLSHNLNQKKLTIAYYLVNGGLLGFAADLLFLKGSVFIPFYVILLVGGIISFLSFLHEAYQHRARKNTDIGMKQSLFAMGLLFLPLVLGILISLNSTIQSELLYQVYLVYGLSFFLGLISALILGQTYKTLPFIVWLHKYKKLIGKVKTPLPKDMYSENIAQWQFRCYIIALLLLVSGILSSYIPLIQLGGIFLLLTAMLYNVNVFKIIFHSIKSSTDGNI